MRYTDPVDWFAASPQACLGCGSLVHWLHTESHDEWHADMLANAWDEGYGQGVADERTSAAVGTDYGPNRDNPYRSHA